MKKKWHAIIPPVNIKQLCIGRCLYLLDSLEKPRGKAKEGRVAEVQQLASPQHLAAFDTYSVVPRATSTSPPLFSFFLRSLPLPIFALFRPRPACHTTSNIILSNFVGILFTRFRLDRAIQTMLHWFIIQNIIFSWEFIFVQFLFYRLR